MDVMKKILVFVTLVLVSLIAFAILANSFNNVNPESVFKYRIKRFDEKVTMLLKFSSDSKADYYRELLGRRMKELTFVVNGKDKAFIETTSQRYESTVSEMGNFIISHGLTSKKASAEDELKKNANDLAILKNKFDASTAEYRFVMNDVNVTNDYLNLLK